MEDAPLIDVQARLPERSARVSANLGGTAFDDLALVEVQTGHHEKRDGPVETDKLGADVEEARQSEDGNG